ncbi:MAG: DUF4258 domain-containing protein [Thermoleophilia bacterium]
MDHSLEFTQHARDVIEARGIDPVWVASAVNSPEATVRDIRDAQLTHALRRIPEHGNRALRVVYNHTVDPPRVVTAYFDRTLKGKL